MSVERNDHGLILFLKVAQVKLIDLDSSMLSYISFIIILIYIQKVVQFSRVVVRYHQQQ